MANILHLSPVQTLLYCWLERSVPQNKLNWLLDKTEKLATTPSDFLLFTSFSSVPRYTSKVQLELNEEDLQAAEKVCRGWIPSQWSLDQAGRVLLLLSLPTNNSDRYYSWIEKLFWAADINEQIVLYQSLALLSHPERFKLRAAEGIRSNMTSVFNAVALNNPYPAMYLDELAWNQMVLKALFVESPLQPIYGLEKRNNPQLAQMLIDYANERLAAGRTVSSELCELAKVFQPKVANSLAAEFKS